MTRPIRIGVSLHPQHTDYKTIRSAVVRAEEMGVDAVFTWDHFYPLYGEPDGAHFECWTMLASFAEITERVAIGPLVACNSYRNPELLADMARTIDHISDGRFILGLGAGWFERDYDEYGYDFGTPGSRLAALRAALPRVRDRLGKLNPGPLGSLPLMIGGGGEKKTLRYTAEFADIWHGFGDAEVLARKHRILDEHCAAVGRDPSEIERSAGARPTAIESADALLEAGTTFITLGFDGATGYDMSVVPEWLAWKDQQNQGS